MMRGKDLITTQEWSDQEVDLTIRLAERLKMERHAGILHNDILPGKTLFSIFYNSSTRTRCSFEAAMFQLGGQTRTMDPGQLQISVGEEIRDTARVLSRYGEGISVRYCFVKEQYGEGNGVLRKYAEESEVPVINMECDTYHPCQALADLQTIKERWGDLRGKKFVMSWAFGKYIRPVAVPQSAILLMSRFGMDVVLAHPQGFEVDPKTLEQAKTNSEMSKGSFEVVNDMNEAFKGAHVVYPKNWGALSVFPDMDKVASMQEAHKDWKATEEKMKLIDKKGIYMHCLPCDRGLEVEDAVIDGPQSAVWDQAENRLHAQKAVLSLVMGGLH